MRLSLVADLKSDSIPKLGPVRKLEFSLTHRDDIPDINFDELERVEAHLQSFPMSDKCFPASTYTILSELARQVRVRRIMHEEVEGGDSLSILLIPLFGLSAY